jgi:hypothetical protein
MMLMLISTFVIFVCCKPLVIVQSSPLLTNFDASVQNYSSIAPHLYVYPGSVIANVGQTFTISIIVTNLTNSSVPDPYAQNTSILLGNMLGFDIQLSWDPTVIHCISHTVTVPFESYSTPISPSPYPGVLHSPMLPPLKNVVNDTGNITDAVDPSVRAWFAYASNAGASVFNGNGTICTLTFIALTKGESPIRIVNATLAGVYEIGSEASTIGQSATGQWLNDPVSGIFTVEATTLPSRSVTFTESGLPVGTSWNVTFNGITLSNSSSAIAFSVINNGSYSYTVGTVSGYTASPSKGSVTVNGSDINQQITFAAVVPFSSFFIILVPIIVVLVAALVSVALIVRRRALKKKRN